MGPGGAEAAAANGLKGISGITVNPDDFDDTKAQNRRRGKRLTEAGQWEARQVRLDGRGGWSV